MAYYKNHVFFCVNQRDGGRASCADVGACELRSYAKQRVKALGLAGRGEVRINAAGCLDRCGHGPVVVVYPDETWYRLRSKADVDEFVESHLLAGTKVDRLLLD